MANVFMITEDAIAGLPGFTDAQKQTIRDKAECSKESDKFRVIDLATDIQKNAGENIQLLLKDGNHIFQVQTTHTIIYDVKVKVPPKCGDGQ